MNFRNLSLSLFCFYFVSCTSHMRSWESSMERKGSRGRTPASMMKNKANFSSKAENLSFSSRVKSIQNRRKTINDLYDNDSDGSLWMEGRQENYLFARNNTRKEGDIIIIDVGDQLRESIIKEFNRVFSGGMGMLGKENTSGNLRGLNKRAVSNVETSGNKEEVDIKEKISTIIVEDISHDHFIVRGKKKIMHKGKKRLLVLDALISKNDILNTDMIHSDKILDIKITASR